MGRPFEELKEDPAYRTQLLTIIGVAKLFFTFEDICF
jgi:hypothetical protein